MYLGQHRMDLRYFKSHHFFDYFSSSFGKLDYLNSLSLQIWFTHSLVHSRLDTRFDIPGKPESEILEMDLCADASSFVNAIPSFCTIQ